MPERRSKATERRGGPRSSPRAGASADGGKAARLRQLRRRAAGSVPGRLFLATLRIRIPRHIWNGPFSSAHPGVRLEVLNRGDLRPGVSISDYWISGLPGGVWASEIAGFPDVVKVDSLAEVGDGCLYRITYRDPPVVSLYRRLELPLQFPLRVQGGFITWEVAARYAEFQEILGHARAADPGLSIVSIRRRPLRSHLPLLTASQQELLYQAMAAGYFAVPRGITLTALARKLQRSKSSISEALALIEQKLFETALRPPTAPV